MCFFIKFYIIRNAFIFLQYLRCQMMNPNKNENFDKTAYKTDSVNMFHPHPHHINHTNVSMTHLLD